MDLKNIFINSAGRLRSGWRLLVFLLVYLCILFLFSSLARLAYAVVLNAEPQRIGSDYIQNVIFRVILLVTALAAGFICSRWLEGLPWRALGLWFHEGWLRDLIVGSLIGILSLALATAIATAGGGFTFTISGRAALVQVLQTLIFSAALFMVAALAEEGLFRGYPLQTLTRANLNWFGVFLTSLAFAGVHLENPNLAAGFSLINTLLAGIWFAAGYLRTRTLWLPLGLHWAWNWAQGSIFGIPVSGIANLAPHPLMRGTDHGPAWLTGGSYGIEGGLACTIALIVATIFILRTSLISTTPEMKQLTSQENPVKARGEWEGETGEEGKRGTGKG
jgi:membrane protease YdiL (CAAX protease family)